MLKRLCMRHGKTNLKTKKKFNQLKIKEFIGKNFKAKT